MSDRASSSDIRGLTSAIRALTLAVSGQSQENPSPAGSESTEGDWSVVGGEEQDIRIASDLNCIQVGKLHSGWPTCCRGRTGAHSSHPSRHSSFQAFVKATWS